MQKWFNLLMLFFLTETSVLLKMEVWDDDGEGPGDDLVEQLTETFTMEASRSRAEKKEKSLQIKKRTQLDLKISVFCEENWYGPKCNVHCVPSEQSGHYNCEYDSGSKICLEGHSFNCTETIDDCVRGPCSILGGQSVDKINGHICECQTRYTGVLLLPVVISTAVLFLIVVVTSVVICKVYQKQKRQTERESRAQAYAVGLDDIEPYYVSKSTRMQPMTDNNPYSDVEERTETERNTYYNMHGGAANDATIYINQR